MARRRRRLRTNIRSTPYGIQLYTRVGGLFRSQRFHFTKTLTTPAQLLEAYDQEIRAWLTIHRDTPAEQDDDPTPGSLDADIARYLKSRAALPSIAERRRDLQAWVEAFGGDRRRRSIVTLEIQTQRDRWLTVGPRRVQQKGTVKAKRWKLVAKPLSASAVNHRLRALSNVFRVLDGRNKPNPVLEVPEAKEPAAVPRAVTYEALHEILARMPDRGRRLKGESYKSRRTESLAKARVEALIWTGMTPTELSRIDEADIDLRRQLVTIPARRKGEGAPGRIIPLKKVPEGMRALKRLLELKALGPFDDGVVRRAWQRAAASAGYHGLTLYTVRHSFVTQILSATKDFRQAQLLAGHSDPRTTQRYMLAAVLPTLEHGMGQMRDDAMNGRRKKKKRR